MASPRSVEAKCLHPADQAPLAVADGRELLRASLASSRLKRGQSFSSWM